MTAADPSDRSPSPDMVTLADALLCDDLSAAELARLERAIADDPTARRQYVRYIYDTLNLLDLAGQPLNGQAELPVLLEPPEDPPLVARSAARRWSQAAWETFKQPMSLSVVVASLVMLIIVLSLELWELPVSRVADPTEDWSTEYVAKVSGAYQVRFAEGQSLRSGEALFGQHLIDLERGLLEVTFESGARALLEGPCRLVVDAPNAATLLAGRMTAQVPPAAIGYAVTTDHLTVVDVGTEFGVETHPGGTEVGVFQGRVEVEYPAAADASRRTIVVDAGSAVAVDAAGDVRHVSSRPRRFTRTAQLPRTIEVVSYEYQPGALGAPEAEYLWPDTDGRELINRKLAGVDFRDPQWVGFPDESLTLDKPHPLITFDFGQPVDVREVSCVYLHSHGVPLQQAGGSITAPEEVWISASDDGVHYSEPVKYTPFDQRPGNAVRLATIPLEEVSGRFVRLDFRNSSQWTFLSEVTFLGSQ